MAIQWSFASGRARLGLALVCALLLQLAVIGPANAQSASDARAQAASSETDKLGSVVSDSVLAELAANASSARATATTNVEAHGPDLIAIHEAIREVGGEAYGEVPGFFVEAWVPVRQLERLHNSPAVDRLKQVTRVSNETADGSLANNPALTSVIEDAVLLDQWHSAGYRGEGQRIGILDLFGSDELQLAIRDNRIPVPSGTFCQRNGSSCAISANGGGPHGVAVAEIVHQVAPEAELYLASVRTVADLAAAIEWFGREGVTVINRSETAELDGPGNGTGPTASIIDRAIELDMVWVAAAGNAGGNASLGGENWIGDFNDPDGNGFHNFENGGERMAFTCGFILGMRWDDWAAGTIPTDFDLWIYDTPSAVGTEARGADLQSTENHVPLEHVSNTCNTDSDIDYIAIRRFNDVRPDGTDEIQILGNQTTMQEWTNDRAATGPGNDSSNPGAVVVGSTVRASDNTRAGYSSQGPTFDGRNGVDILAPSCLPIPDFFSFCFTGTSASAPVMGGIVGVLRSAGLIENAEDVDAILRAISIDTGVPGPDPQNGYGFLNLPSPAALGVEDSVPSCNGARATIVGTPGNDVLVGTSGVDIIFTGRGNDRVKALGGDDIICTGRGNDVISAGAGNDTVLAGPGNDDVRGQLGNDALSGGAGADELNGNLGSDQIFGDDGRDKIQGGKGDDTVAGGKGQDRLFGGVGDDRVFGGAGADSCPDAIEHRISCDLS